MNGCVQTFDAECHGACMKHIKMITAMYMWVQVTTTIASQQTETLEIATEM